jgi:hypothetical protein
MYVLIKSNGRAFARVDNSTLQEMINKTVVDFKPCANDSTRTKVIFRRSFRWGTKADGKWTGGCVLQLIIFEGDMAVPEEVLD